ncbi:PREDICTED: upstream activation factor subunit spp27 [Ceratosolen solmsi marchali]|uniref:Upstream activation factor subunit spp27 n=1 Tax=Ceratosolen solmsi marchali TaxID=326594 RepID=A0AAJ6YF51_9HYME|nr:PREDICTED: upstream activation factor subunit spp27 [Ceratosolen solmsi marchali]
MADISKDELRKEITAILKDADLTSMSAKKVRQQMEEKLDVDLTERKKEIDDLVMECLQDKQDGGKKKKKAASEESEDGVEEEEEASEEEEEEEEKKPAKRAPPKKPPTKRKKASSDDEESASDDDDSDEDYKTKPSRKKGKAGKKGKKGKGANSDSDSDWGKSKKSGAKGKKGGTKGAGKGGGNTRAKTLSADLAAIVGAKQMTRHEAVKKVWSVIKERNLYDPKNKQFAICDDDLMKVIGVKRFRVFGMLKYLKDHFID